MAVAGVAEAGEGSAAEARAVRGQTPCPLGTGVGRTSALRRTNPITILDFINP